MMVPEGQNRPHNNVKSKAYRNNQAASGCYSIGRQHTLPHEKYTLLHELSRLVIPRCVGSAAASPSSLEATVIVVMWE